MTSSETFKSALRAALPVMGGYVAIGLPCGIVESQVGYSWWMAFVMSITLYSGAGQFMIPGMWMAGLPPASIIASVSFVNTRQVLYSAAFSPFFDAVGKLKALLFSATVTDETFGVNMQRFAGGEWTAAQATLVNIFCMFTWGISNAAGVLAGDVLDIPTAIAAFSMTSIFICLLMGQEMNALNIVVIAVSAAGAILCKAVGLTGLAILVGAVAGVVAGMLFKKAAGSR